MQTKLQEELTRRLAEKNMTSYAVQKKTGINGGTIRNILNGISTNPTLNVLLKLTDILDCSLSDLVGDGHKHIATELERFHRRKDLDYHLLQKVSDVVMTHVQGLNGDISFTHMTKGVMVLYLYCETNQYKDPPHDFCSWHLIHNFMNEPESKA